MLHKCRRETSTKCRNLNVARTQLARSIPQREISRLNSRITYLGFDTVSFDANLTRRRRRRGFSNSQIARQYNSARIYGRRVSSYSGCMRATVQTRGENGCTNVRELTMYGVCALSETQIAMRTQRQSSEIRSTCGRVKPVRAFHVCCSSTRARAGNTINRIETREMHEFNRILIFLFV